MRPALFVPLAMCLLLTVTTSVMAQSPAPPPYPEDAEVTFEPAGPSVWRVIEPEWDCDAKYPRQPFYHGAEVAADGRVWFLDRYRGSRELGSCPIVEPRGMFSGVRDQALGPDDTLWLLNDDRLWSWDGADWHVHLEGFNQPGRSSYAEDGGYSYSIDCEAGPCYHFVDVAPDGTVWLSGDTVSAFDGVGWTDYLVGRWYGDVIGFGPDGAAWIRGDDGLLVIQPSGSAPAPPPTAESPAPATSDIASGLVASFPAAVGSPREIKTWTGPEWIARLDPVLHRDANVIRAAEALVAAAGATLDDLTIATVLLEPSPGNFASIAAVHVPGVPASDLMVPVIDLMVGDFAEPWVSWQALGERWVARVIDLAMPGVYPVTFYPAGDSMWVIQAEPLLVGSIVAELPPQEAAVRPAASPSSQRVEVPGPGIALTFPDDWTVEEMPATNGEVLGSVLDAEMRDLLTAVVAAAPPHGHDRCAVVDISRLVDSQPSWGSTEDIVAGLLRMLEDPWWGRITTLDLPAGRAEHTLLGVDGDAEFVSTYYFTQDDAWFALECVSRTVPPFVGLSIAETFEFLPAEE